MKAGNSSRHQSRPYTFEYSGSGWAEVVSKRPQAIDAGRETAADGQGASRRVSPAMSVAAATLAVLSMAR
jgi:hypothetical protein